MTDSYNRPGILLDPVFKFVLSLEQGPTPLLSFLNAFQQSVHQSLVTELFPISPILDRDLPEDRTTIADVAARDETGRIFQAEVQFANHSGFLNRNIYAWSRRYGRQLKPGQMYSDLRPVIHIIVTNFVVFPEFPENHHVCQLTLQGHPEREMSNHCRFHILEICPQKLSYIMDQPDLLGYWSRFLYFGNSRLEDKMSLEANADPGIQTALDRYYKFCQDNNLRHLAEADEYHAMDYATGFEDARKMGEMRGLKRGLAEGKAEGKAESVQQLLQLKFPEQSNPLLFTRIQSISSMDLLDKIFAKAVTATSLEEVEKDIPTES